MKLVSILIGYLLLANPCSGEITPLSNSICQKLSEIPKKDSFYLEFFFQTLVKCDGLSYTLFGSKPACLSAYFANAPIENRLFGGDTSLLKKGWETWKKYEHFFPHPHFLIFEESENLDGTEIHSLYFINKENLLESLTKNEMLFKKELGNDFNPQEFLLKIERFQSLFPLIKKHEGLLGILLGYGFESSMHYYRRDSMWKTYLPTPYEEIHLLPVSNDFPKIDFVHPDIRPIQFVGNPYSPEVIDILEKNQKERESIQEPYSQGKFLEITLEKLMS